MCAVENDGFGIFLDYRKILNIIFYVGYNCMLMETRRTSKNKKK